MPRYYFHAEDGRPIPDRQGTDLPDVQAARLKATRILAELLKEQPAELWDTGRLRVQVTDARRRKLFELSVSLSCEAA